MAITYPIQDSDTFTIYDTDTSAPLRDGKDRPMIKRKWGSSDVDQMIDGLATNIKWLIEVQENEPAFDVSVEKLEAFTNYDIPNETVTKGWNIVAKTDEEKVNHINDLAIQQDDLTRELANKRIQDLEMDSIRTEAGGLTDEDALENTDMFAAYLVGYDYVIGDRFIYPVDGNLYRVIQNHPSAIHFAPDVSISLYEKVQVLVIGDVCDTAPLWDANNAVTYTLGTKVKQGSAVYEATGITHMWIEPAETGNGAISWTKVKDCP